MAIAPKETAITNKRHFTNRSILMLSPESCLECRDFKPKGFRNPRLGRDVYPVGNNPPHKDQDGGLKLPMQASACSRRSVPRPVHESCGRIWDVCLQSRPAPCECRVPHITGGPRYPDRK